MQSLAQYQLNEQVGTGRLFDVYRAKDTALGRTVTIHVLHPETADAPARLDELLNAARAVLPLSHPNIATLFEVAEDAGKHFLVFEYTAGETLRATVAGSPLNLRRAVDLGVQLTDALADAHGQGFVHGAVQPESIVVTQKGKIKVLGFGLPPSPGGTAIQDDAALTPDDVECMAPERVLGQRGDSRADIFSLGCVLFEMVTGTQPFAAATASDTAVAILSRTPAPPSQLNARVPEALDRVIGRCLAKSVERRSDNAATVAAELREIAMQMEADEQMGAEIPLLPGRRRARRTWLIALLVVLCLAALAAIAAVWVSKL